MKDMAEKGLYTMLGAWLLIHEKADEIMKEMVAKGKEAPEGGRSVVDEMSKRVDEEKEELKGWIAQNMSSAMREAGMATKEDIDDIRARMDEIESRLAVVEAKEISIEKKTSR
ncbi:MAG: hypothetical protein C4521_00650 [Actinobacteria bacterium]|nr:MAG: hypothetical protein C4521_00650 [Actinomycetota bacterium]